MTYILLFFILLFVVSLYPIFFVYPKNIRRYKVFSYIVKSKNKIYRQLVKELRAELIKVSSFAELQQKAILALKNNQTEILLDKFHGLINVQAEMLEKLLFPPTSMKAPSKADFLIIKDSFLEVEVQKNKAMEEAIKLGGDPEVNFYSQEAGGGMYAPLSEYKEKYKNDFIKHIFSELNNKFKTSLFILTKEMECDIIYEKDEDETNGEFFLDLIKSLEEKNKKKAENITGLNKKRQ